MSTAARKTAVPLLLGLLVFGIALAALAPREGGPPLDPGSAARDGLLGLVRVMDALDVDVSVSLDVPVTTDTVVFVPLDLLNTERRDALTGWVRDGGTLVVAGADSPFHGREDLGAPLAAAFGPTARSPGCDLPGLEDVGEVRHDGWSDLAPDDGDAQCFSSEQDGAWLLTSELGSGRLVVLGSADAFTNRWLDEADNAVLAAALFGPSPGARLHIVPRPPADERDVGLLDLVDPGIWRALALVTVAGVVAVIARSRRLGPPVEERLPPVLPSGELARSLAGLTARAGNRTGAAQRLRSVARGRATRALGLSRSAEEQLVVTRLVAVTDISEEDAHRAIASDDVANDEDLVAVARSVGRVLDRLDHPLDAPASASDAR